MPLSNVFRHSLPNPFHGATTSRKKANSDRNGRQHHESHHYSRSRSESVSSLTLVDNAVVTPVAEVEYNNMKNSTDVKRENIRGKNKITKSYSLSPPSSSSSSSGLIAQLGVSMAQASAPSPPRSRSQTPLSMSSTPTSASFSPAPPSPEIHMPSSPCPSSSPSTPNALHQCADRGLASSPEPMTPDKPTVAVPKTASGSSGTGTIGSKFGSMFFKTHSSQLQQQKQLRLQQQELHRHELDEEHILSMPQHDKQTPSQGIGQREAMRGEGVMKKKRVSSGSLQIPIGAFLSNTFRSKQQPPTIVTTATPPQMVNVQESRDCHPQQQKPVSDLPLSQRRKRSSLLPKLPLLDTRPRAVPSSPKSNKKNKISLSRAIDQYLERGTGGATPTAVDPVIAASGSTKGSTVNGGGNARMLSPFYLPAVLRQRGSSWNYNPDPSVHLPPTPAPISLGNNLPPPPVQELCPQTAQQSSRTELDPTNTDINTSLWDDWRLYSHIYHDDRWDCASVCTTNSDLHRLSADPGFPGYPERNDYWKRHCRIRERCQENRQHHSQHLQQDRAKENPVTSAKEEELTSPLSFERNAHGESEHDGDSSVNDDNSHQADQQQEDPELHPLEKLKDARRRLRSAAERDVPRRHQQQKYTTYTAYTEAMQIMTKERVERSRSTDSKSLALGANISTADRQSLDIKAEAEQQLQHLQKKQQWQYVKCQNVTNLGRSEESGQPVHRTANPQGQHQLDSGILFVSSTTTTAEVYASPTHDPRSRRTRTLSAAAIPKMEDYLEHQHNKTSTTKSHEDGDVKYGFGGGLGYVDKKIGGLVATYFDNIVTPEDCHGI